MTTIKTIARRIGCDLGCRARLARDDLVGRERRVRVLPDALAVVVLALISVGAFWQVLFTNGYSLLSYPDDSDQSYAWFQYLSASIGAKRIPLWDPYTFAGHPFTGEIQGGAFYPPNLVLAVLANGGTISSHSIEIFLLLHLVAGAAFAYSLGRYLGLDIAPAIVSGSAFAFGGVVLGRIQGQSNLFAGLIWLPLALLCLEAGLRRRSLALGLTGGAVAAMALLAGHFEPAYHTVFVLGLLALWHVLRSSNWTGRLVAAFVGCAALVGFLLVSAVQLLPTLEYSNYAVQYVFSGPPLPTYERLPYSVVTTLSVHPSNFLSIVFPQVLSPADTNPYLGIGVVGLAIVALVWSRHRWIGFLLLVAAIGLLTALGSMSVLHGWEYAFIPGSDRVREAGRRLYLFQFAAAFLAGFGMQALVAAGRPRYTRIARAAKFGSIPLVVTILAGLAMVIASVGQPNPAALGVSDALFHTALVGAAVLGCGAALATRRLSARQGAAIIVAICVWDLLSAGDLTPQQISEFDRGLNRYPELWYAANPLTDYLRAHVAEGRVEIFPENMPRNIGDTQRLYTTFGHTATMLESYYSYYLADGNPRSPFNEMLGVRYYISATPRGPDKPLVSSGGLSVFSVETALPRAWIARSVSTVSDPDLAINAINSPSFDPGHDAVVDRAPRAGTIVTGNYPADHVTILDGDPLQLSLLANLGAPGLLVTGDIYYPGWTAFVDGKATDIVPADVALRGVYLDAGSHAVTFVYRPTSFRNGLLLSYTGLALLVALLASAIVGGGRTRRMLVGLAALVLLLVAGYLAWHDLDPLGERAAQTLSTAVSLVDRLPAASIKNPTGGAPPVGPRTVAVDGVSKVAILQHPDSTVTFDLHVPVAASLQVTTGIDPSCRTISKGASFQVSAQLGNSTSVLYQRDSTTETGLQSTGWQPARVDLTPYGGQDIRLTLTTGPGQSGNYSCDWAEWVDPLIVGN